MIPVNQTKFGKGNGNCASACLASILEIELDDVPNFTEGNSADWQMWQKMLDWLGEKGYALATVYMPGGLIGIGKDEEVYAMAGVRSQALEGCYHSVIVRITLEDRFPKIEIVHDPNPNNEPYSVNDIKDIALLVPLKILLRAKVLKSENILRYSELLKQLHRMFDEGAGESDEADAIRDEMMDLWKPMTPEEQDHVRTLSVEMKRKARADAMAKEGSDTLPPSSV